ncbi:hypothetical protein IWQ57_006686, partial [Coemansia nantahalensis]
MKLTALSVALAAVLAAGVSPVAATTIDWNAQKTYTCAIQNWQQIRMAVNPLIQSSWNMLPPPLKQQALDAHVVNPDFSLIVNPSPAQLQIIAQVFPTGLFHPHADNIVSECVEDDNGNGNGNNGNGNGNGNNGNGNGNGNNGNGNGNNGNGNGNGNNGN